MRLVRRSKSPEIFDQLLERSSAPCFFKPVHDDLGRAYFKAIEGESFSDHSFALEVDGQCVTIVECNRIGEELLRFGLPIEVHFDCEAPAYDERRAIREILGELQRVSQSNEIKTIKFRTTPDIDPKGLLTSRLLALKASARIEFRAVADLTASEEALQKDLRKGHRQQVKWGKEHLQLTHLTAENADAQAFDQIRQFHAEVAGKVTRPVESWQAMFEYIRQNRGEAILGCLDNELVAANIVLDSDRTSYYSSGIYDREHFDKPLAHYPLLTAILRAKQRGGRSFDIGEIPREDSGASSKEISIGHFKQGFTSQSVNSLIWEMRIAI